MDYLLAGEGHELLFFLLIFNTLQWITSQVQYCFQPWPAVISTYISDFSSILSDSSLTRPQELTEL